MIYVSEDQLTQVEYLIQQSLEGNHVLFNPSDLKTSLSESCGFSEEEAFEVEHHLERIILQPTLVQKRAYMERLDSGTFHKVVRTYFNIVENNLFERKPLRH